MNKIKEALQENIIETHNGMGDYCAFCYMVIEDGRGHSEGCPRELAMKDYNIVIQTLQWYLNDDWRSVEMHILESVEKRPAYSILSRLEPNAVRLCSSKQGGYCELGFYMMIEGTEVEVCPKCGKDIYK